MIKSPAQVTTNQDTTRIFEGCPFFQSNKQFKKKLYGRTECCNLYWNILNGQKATL